MPPLKYHEGQIAVQQEARTTLVAEKLADWVGPVIEFALEADVFVFASDEDGVLRFRVLSGAAPLVAASGPVQRRYVDGAEPSASPVLTFDSGLLPPPPKPQRLGGLAINLATSRRARLNGLASAGVGGTELTADETFALCRKYIATSASFALGRKAGPVVREAIELTDAWLQRVIAEAETSFLASASPSGAPDVAHRGGPAGFLTLDAERGELRWQEYVGDGVFKSAGNIRATSRMTLLVPDFETGDGVELTGRAEYTNLRGGRRERLDALEQHGEAHPVQGVMTCSIEGAYALRGLLQPRVPFQAHEPVTSRSLVEEQAPR